MAVATIAADWRNKACISAALLLLLLLHTAGCRSTPRGHPPMLRPSHSLAAAAATASGLQVTVTLLAPPAGRRPPAPTTASISWPGASTRPAASASFLGRKPLTPCAMRGGIVSRMSKAREGFQGGAAMCRQGRQANAQQTTLAPRGSISLAAQPANAKRGMQQRQQHSTSPQLGAAPPCHRQHNN